jgi:hypothetical protein
MAVGSVLHEVVNADLDATQNVGIQLIGSTAVIGWDTLKRRGIDLAEITMPAGSFSITQPPRAVPSEFTPLFGDTGGCWCGCGSVNEGCVAIVHPPQVPGPVNPSE